MPEHEPLLGPQPETEQLRIQEGQPESDPEEELREEFDRFSQDMAVELAGDCEDSDVKSLFMSWCRHHELSLEIDSEKPLEEIFIQTMKYAREPSTILGLTETCRQIISLTTESKEDHPERFAALLALQHVLVNVGQLESIIDDTQYSDIIKFYQKEDFNNLLTAVYDSADLSGKRIIARTFARVIDNQFSVDTALWEERQGLLAKRALEEINTASNISMDEISAIDLICDVANSGVRLNRQEQSVYETLPNFLVGMSFDELLHLFLYWDTKRPWPKNLFNVVWNSFRSLDVYSMRKEEGAAAGRQAPVAAEAHVKLSLAIHRAQEARVHVPKDIMQQYNRLNTFAEPYRRGLQISERSSGVLDTSISLTEE